MICDVESETSVVRNTREIFLESDRDPEYIFLKFLRKSIQ